MKTLFLFVSALLLLTSNAMAADEDSPWYKRYTQITYSELRTLIDSGKVEEARVMNDGWWVTVKTTEGEFFDAQVTPQTPIADHLYEAGVPAAIFHKQEDEADDDPLWLSVFLNLLPLLIFIFVFFVVLWLVQKQSKKTQEECLDRAQAINNDFLEKQQAQFDKFIEQFSSMMKAKE